MAADALRLKAVTFAVPPLSVMAPVASSRTMSPLAETEPADPKAMSADAPVVRSRTFRLLPPALTFVTVTKSDVVPKASTEDTSPEIRRANNSELIRELDAVFATKPFAEWAEIFDRENVWFAPFLTIPEVASDPLAIQAGAFVEVNTPDGPRRQVATPADFYGTPIGDFGWSPEMGEHTEQILLDLGFDWEQIAGLKERGAIP